MAISSDVQYGELFPEAEDAGEIYVCAEFVEVAMDKLTRILGNGEMLKKVLNLMISLEHLIPLLIYITIIFPHHLCFVHYTENALNWFPKDYRNALKGIPFQIRMTLVIGIYSNK